MPFGFLLEGEGDGWKVFRRTLNKKDQKEKGRLLISCMQPRRKKGNRLPPPSLKMINPRQYSSRKKAIVQGAKGGQIL